MAHLVALPDVDASSGRFVKNAASLSLGLIRSSERNDELHSGNSDRPDRGSLDHEACAAQNAIDFAKSSKAIAVVFSNRVRFFNRNVIHDGCPEPEAARDYQNTSDRNLNHNSSNDSRNRFRAASCTKSTQLDRDTGVKNAADDRGKSSTALVHRGEGQFTAIQFGPIFIPHQTETIHHTSAIITSAPVRMGMSFAICPRSSRSNSQSLRFAGATALAAISVAHPMLAKASGRVGV